MNDSEPLVCRHVVWHWEQGLLAWLKICDACGNCLGIGGKAYGRYRVDEHGSTR